MSTFSPDVFHSLVPRALRRALMPAEEGAPLLIWNRDEDCELADSRALHVAHPTQLWAPRPGATMPWAPGESINALGLRGPLPRRRRPDLRVAWMGESTAFGMGVRDEETAARVLEHALCERGRDAEVINAAVIGATVAQGLERFRDDVALLRPHVVIACFGTVNEPIPAQQLTDVPKIALLRDRARSNFLRQWLGDRDARWSWDGELARRLSGPDRPPAADEAETRAEGWFHNDWPYARRMSLDDYEDGMAQLVDAVESTGARILFVAMPKDPEAARARPALAPYRERLGEAAARHGWELLELDRTFDERYARGADPTDFFADAWHLNAEGHRVFAESVFDRLDD